MVEAPGVEPGSEDVAGKETTYLVAFTLPAFTENLRSARSERTRCASLDKGSYGWLDHAGIDSIVGFYRTSKIACRVTARGAAEWSRAAFCTATFRTPPKSLPITPAISAALASFIPWRRRIQTSS